MAYVGVTYHDLITHTNHLGIQFIPWDHCKRDQKLGGGASMNVFSGTYEVNGITQDAAFKFVTTSLTEKTREKKRSNTLRDVRQEIRIMGLLKGHSRIVQLFGVSFDDHIPILILEVAKSNLEEFLQLEHVEWKIKFQFIYDIVLGIEAMHRAEVVHGDLKAANILVYDGVDDGQLVAKISDFGYSCTYLSVQEGRTPGFTYNFRSRECFDLELKDWNGKYTTDIYSCGLVVYQIADNGTIPFEDFDGSEIDDMKKGGTELEVLMELLPSDAPMEIRKIMTMTIRNVPSERSDLNELKNVLKESKGWNYIYSYEEVKTSLEAGPGESLLIYKMRNLPISSSLKKSIFCEYQRLADAGDVIAQTRLGACWEFGFGTEKDILKAVEYYSKAAEAGNATAQMNLGYLYRYGDGVTKDYTKSVELYTKAAESGNTQAQVNLGDIYHYGEAATKDYTKAVEQYTKAAEAGNSAGQAGLALCYINGNGVTRDYVKAVELFTKAAEADNLLAQDMLGDCYKDGKGVTKDYIKAAEMYAKAAKAGSGDSQNSLGDLYYHGHGVTKDCIKAVELYTKAAEAGNQYAQASLGLCYEQGIYVIKDYVKAIELYTKTAEAGNADGQKNLGDLYYYGRGVTKDYIKAVELYTKAAEDNADAREKLGDCYSNGYGVIKDNVKAIELYTMAAEAGNASAQHKLSVIRRKDFFSLRALNKFNCF